MPDPSRPTPPRRPARTPVRAEELTPLGRVVLGAGLVTRLLARGVDAALDRVADVVVRSEKAFKEGRDGVEEATVVRDSSRPAPPPARPPSGRVSP